MTGCDILVPENDISTEPGARTLGFLLVDGFALMSYASVVEPFRAANVLSGRHLYRWRHVSVDGRAVHASNGATILADAAVGHDLHCNTLFVFAAGKPATFEHAPTFAWLRWLARQNVTLAGVSGGPFVLAKAGVLDGHRCTIHWDHLPEFVEAFPDLTLEHGLYVIDRKRLTCAGGTAGMDMAIDMIEREHGHALAVKVSDWFIRTQPRQPEGAQRMDLRERYNVSNDRLLRVLAHMERTIEEPEDRAALTLLAGISMRQLERLFLTHLRASIGETYRHIRLEHAHALLEKTGRPITTVAYACGFTSSSHFSRSFKKRFGCSPSAVRRDPMVKPVRRGRRRTLERGVVS